MVQNGIGRGRRVVRSVASICIVVVAVGSGGVVVVVVMV